MLLLPPSLRGVGTSEGDAFAASSAIWAVGDLDPSPQGLLAQQVQESSRTLFVQALVEDDRVSSTITATVLSAGQLDPNPANSQMIVFDLETARASVGGSVWQDDDGDGEQKGGEPGMAGVTILLQDAGGGWQQTSTAADGGYSFGDLSAGVYTLTVETSTLPVGYDLSTTAIPQVVELATGEAYTGADFGFTQPATIGDFIYLDANGNGRQDASELMGVDNVPVFVTNLASGSELVAVAANGVYSVTRLLPGTYRVSVPTSVPGMALTSRAELVVTLSAGQVYDEADFGYIPPTAVQLASFTGGIEDGVIVLRWRTSNEEEEQGFVVWRALRAEGPYKPVSGLIPADNQPTGSDYRWRDFTVFITDPYWYRLQSLPDGEFFGPIAVQPPQSDRDGRLFIPLIVR
jgi:hypothetical protein